MAPLPSVSCVSPSNTSGRVSVARVPEPAAKSFYRAVSIAELAAIRKTGRLGPGTNSFGSGKHLWGTVEAATAYRERIRALGWDPPADHIVCVKFSAEVAEKFTYLGARLDGCGPGFYADEAALDSALTIEEMEP
jgi:hypothetical protein